MSLPLPLAAAADLFAEKIAVYDSTTTKTLGRWSSVKGPVRIISGVIQTSKEKKVAVDEDGAISNGNLMLHTRETLFAYDLSQEQAGGIITQTYAIYGALGEVWKLNEFTNWPVKTQGYNLYYLTKFTDIGGI